MPRLVDEHPIFHRFHHHLRYRDESHPQRLHNILDFPQKVRRGYSRHHHFHTHHHCHRCTASPSGPSDSPGCPSHTYTDSCPARCPAPHLPRGTAPSADHSTARGSNPAPSRCPSAGQ